MNLNNQVEIDVPTCVLFQETVYWNADDITVPGAPNRIKTRGNTEQQSASVRPAFQAAPCGGTWGEVVVPRFSQHHNIIL